MMKRLAVYLMGILAIASPAVAQTTPLNTTTFPNYIVNSPPAAYRAAPQVRPGRM